MHRTTGSDREPVHGTASSPKRDNFVNNGVLGAHFSVDDRNGVHGSVCEPVDDRNNVHGYQEQCMGILL